MTAIQLTQRSLEVFLMIARDAGNWGGCPWVSNSNFTLSKKNRGNVTDLKRAGLLRTENAGDEAFFVFTESGKSLAAENGIEL